MSSLISPQEKTCLAANFFNIADTFSRPVTFFKTAQEVVISTSSENNLYFPGAPDNDVIQEVIQSGVFAARIKYDPKEVLTLFGGAQEGNGADQITAKIQNGWVRLKLDATGAAFMANTTRARFDGDIFEVMTSKRPHGLFDPQFETYYLKKLN